MSDDMEHTAPRTTSLAQAPISPTTPTTLTTPTTPTTPPLPRHGLILFGHGARDPRWAEPFERLAARLTERAPSAASQTSPRAPQQGSERTTGTEQQQAPDTVPEPVSLAFLELMTPNLATAVANHVQAGCTVITVVPVFFGVGSHLRRDFPALLDACRAAHPGIDIRSAQAVGEDDGVLDALSDYALRQWQKD